MRTIVRIFLLLLLVVGPACDEDDSIIKPPPAQAPATEAALIDELERTYASLDLPAFTNLFPTASESSYLFLYNEPDPDDGSTSWGRDVELRVHQRMFRPQDTPVGEDPVPAAIWLTGISINLTRVTEFEPRLDLYAPGGEIDPSRWEVKDAEYHAVLFFGTQGETDYTVDGRANFVVINDLTKAAGEDRKLLIYRWEDLGDFSKAAVEQGSWTGVKSMFRN